MGLTNKKEEQLRKMPRIETKVFKSKDGRLLIQRTTISSVKPVAYYEKILNTKETALHLDDFDDSDYFIQEGEELVS